MRGQPRHLDWRGALLHAAVAGIAVFLVAPSLLVAAMSISSSNTLAFPPEGFSWRWYEDFFGNPMWLNAARTSLIVALLTVVLSSVLGTLAAFGLVRGRYPGRGFINALIVSPMIVPVVVLSIGFYFAFARLGLVGSYAGLVLAHSVLALPFVIVTVSASLRGLDQNLELAAQGLGAPPWRMFMRITLPLILPGVAAGAVFAFIISWDEVVVALFLTSPIIRTLPVVMWSQVRAEISPTIAAVATILMAISMLALLSMFVLRRSERR
jgi:putative spermidine/putrescine transport system permease protein